MTARTAPAEITFMSAAFADDSDNAKPSAIDDSSVRFICLPKVGSWLSGMPGLARQHAEVDADLLECPLVFRLNVLAKNQIKIGGAMQPAVFVDFVFQLAWRPARIAEGQHRAT